MRHSISASLRIATVTLCVASATAGAQTKPNPQLREITPAHRDPYWLDVGLGVGSESFNVPGDGLGYSSSLEKPTLVLGIGGTLNQHFRLGAEFFGWFNQERDVLESVSSFALIARYYPARESGFFLKGGAGLGRYGLDFGDGVTQSDLGFAGILGAGYEIRISRKVALAPTVDLVSSSFSGRSYRSYRERVLNIGVSLVIQGDVH